MLPLHSVGPYLRQPLFVLPPASLVPHLLVHYMLMVQGTLCCPCGLDFKTSQRLSWCWGSGRQGVSPGPGTAHTVACTQQSVGKAGPAESRPPFSCFSQLFVLTFPTSWHHINQHLEYQENGGQGKRGPRQNWEGIRKERSREACVNVCESPASSCPVPQAPGMAFSRGGNPGLPWACRLSQDPVPMAGFLL